MIERPGHLPAPVTPLSATSNHLVEMPTRSRALHEQRVPGRPRRIAPTPTDSAVSTPTTSSASFIPIVDPHPISEVPAEEKSYREVFPDLEITKPLPILILPRFPPPPGVDRDDQNQNKESLPQGLSASGENAAGQDLSREAHGAGGVLVDSLGSKASEAELVEDTQIDPLPPAPPSLDFDESSSLVSPTVGGTADFSNIGISQDDEENARTLANLARAVGMPDPQFQITGLTADVGVSAESEPPAPLDEYSGVAELTWLPDLPPAPRHLPKPVFRMLPESDDPWSQRKFRMGDAYIRYVEPSEDELAMRVEYDMDEQDLCWLNLVNEARKKDGTGQMDQDYFEQVMDILEKEWFDLTKDIPSPRDDDEDPVCAVCDDGECENSNAIVFCDGCNIAVHQDCYGIPYIPEGQWLCRKCMLSPHKPVDCILCPHGDGAFKQAAGKGWAHLLCAIWVPECTVGNLTLMEPVVDIQKIPRSRWRLQEYRDEVDVEAAIKEFKKQMIDQTTSLVRRIVSLDDSDDDSFEQSSDEETPRRKLKRKANAYAHDLESSSGGGTATPIRKKRGRSEGSLSTGQLLADFGVSDSETAVNISNQFSTPVVIPEFILRRVLNNLRDDHKEQKRKGDFDRKYKDFIILVCKYWSLKRESRRGAPLLKRLHLEPWTASASALKIDEEARAKRNQTAHIIRKDLEMLRLLVELIRKREKEKMRQYQAGVGYTELLLFPVTRKIRPVFEQIRALDRNGYFSDPVTPEIAPDYFEHVKTPMDFSTIARKVENYEYRDLDTFDADVDLIWTNCMIYNKSETEYYKAAARYQKRAKALIADLRTKLAGLPIDPETGVMKIAPDEFISVVWTCGWPEGMEERPIFPKAESTPEPEIAVLEEKIIGADDYTPFRVTRARIAALEAETPVPKAKTSAKKNGSAKHGNAKSSTSASAVGPKTLIRSSRRGQEEATPSAQIMTRTGKSSKTPAPSSVSTTGLRSGSRARERNKPFMTPDVVRAQPTPAAPVTPEPPRDAKASSDSSLAMAIRPARHAAEVAQKAIMSLTTVVKRASVKRLTPTVVETPLTDREIRALKRGHGEDDNTPSKPPSTSSQPNTDLQPAKRLKLAQEHVPLPLAETSGNTESKASRKGQQSSPSKKKPARGKGDGGEIPHTPLPVRGAGGRFLSVSKAKLRSPPANTSTSSDVATTTPVPNDRTARARMTSPVDGVSAQNTSTRRASLADIKTTSRAAPGRKSLASATSTPFSSATRRRESDTALSSATRTSRRLSSAADRDARDLLSGFLPPPQLATQNLDESHEFLAAFLGVDLSGTTDATESGGAEAEVGDKGVATNSGPQTPPQLQADADHVEL
ncbi:nuA3 HAT complex component nto1 [Geranomyces michiganensis]|nr:nuA3 HAT complex component nto1 [Geranomyces michiganensis]